MASLEGLRQVLPELFALAEDGRENLEKWRRDLKVLVDELEGEALDGLLDTDPGRSRQVSACAANLKAIFARDSEEKTGFSVARVLLDLVNGVERPELKPAFFAEMVSLFQGLGGAEKKTVITEDHGEKNLKGREAAIVRSRQLDAMVKRVDYFATRYRDGLEAEAIARRRCRRERIQSFFQADDSQWWDWHWQLDNIVQRVEDLARMVDLTPAEKAAVDKARRHKLPFGVTPYYLSLMDDGAHELRRDAAIRAQVLPPPEYVEQVVDSRRQTGDFSELDFMREEDTSPIDLITRRYPAICIFKPFNTCPQICVYCQRNWEIEDAMSANALAAPEKIDAAIAWIEAHPAIREVLVTGGDPLAMADALVENIVSRVAAIPTVERIRIGTRTLVTMPMRISDRLAAFLGSLRRPGKLEVVVVTHVEHCYELTPEVVQAVERLRRQGIGVYNQLVYTFFVSRRFEAAFLRRRLRQVGIDPYYTFNTKGKEETVSYRVPVARLLQEQAEEARLSPGIERCDEAVFNVPGQGKSYIRSHRHRYLIGLGPDGSRIYEFYPWEDGIARVAPRPYVAWDVPVLEYLERLAAIGEKPDDYQSIWYYF
ncbi:MAG: KamA family radical SAM protein [Deltaproteobacteria bacterium]|nr:KamA family radical SAM protein [Deltaproteobacteria bacterium]